MDTNVTVSIKGLLAAGVVLLALVVAYLLGDSGGGPAQATAAPVTAAPAATPNRTLTMGGAGEATAVPDQLGFTLTVNATRLSLDTALDDASATTRSVLERLAALGVEKKDVQTTGLSMNPVYDYHDSGPPTLRGYRVSQRAQVLVTELKQGGAALAAAVATGGNGVRVGDIRLSVADPDAVLAEARQAAVAEATAKAQEYADATGQQLGDVMTLREVSATQPRSGYAEESANYGLRASLDATASVPIRAGEEDLAVRVEVVWRLAD